MTVRRRDVHHREVQVPVRLGDRPGGVDVAHLRPHARRVTARARELRLPFGGVEGGPVELVVERARPGTTGRSDRGGSPGAGPGRRRRRCTDRWRGRRRRCGGGRRRGRGRRGRRRRRRRGRRVRHRLGRGRRAHGACADRVRSARCRFRASECGVPIRMRRGPLRAGACRSSQTAPSGRHRRLRSAPVTAGRWRRECPAVRSSRTARGQRRRAHPPSCGRPSATSFSVPPPSSLRVGKAVPLLPPSETPGAAKTCQGVGARRPSQRSN